MIDDEYFDFCKKWGGREIENIWETPDFCGKMTDCANCNNHDFREREKKNENKIKDVEL